MEHLRRPPQYLIYLSKTPCHGGQMIEKSRKHQRENWDASFNVLSVVLIQRVNSYSRTVRLVEDHLDSMAKCIEDGLDIYDEGAVKMLKFNIPTPDIDSATPDIMEKYLRATGCHLISNHFILIPNWWNSDNWHDCYGVGNIVVDRCSITGDRIFPLPLTLLRALYTPVYPILSEEFNLILVKMGDGRFGDIELDYAQQYLNLAVNDELNQWYYRFWEKYWIPVSEDWIRHWNKNTHPSRDIYPELPGINRRMRLSEIWPIILTGPEGCRVSEEWTARVAFKEARVNSFTSAN